MRNRLIVIIAIVIAIAGSVWFWKNKQAEKKQAEIAAEKKTAITLPAINGVLVEENLSRTRPIAVIIENHVQARPQSGLALADIVYETLAEGGITRFLALYQTQTPTEIGPVRSARPYFNHLANQWGAIYAHVGGSTIALSELNANMYKKIVDLNQYFYGDYFYRSRERSAPHNAYTSMKLLRDLASKKQWEKWEPVKLGEFETIPTEQLQTNITKITAKYFDPNYTAIFQFDPATGLYARSSGNKQAIDKNNNQQLHVRNVLVQYVDDYVVPLETVNGLGLRLEQEGKAILFTGGTAIEGRWRYKNGFTEYLNSDGQPLKFQPGQTWIILQPNSLTNNVTWQ
jgi:hypothetical protein